ncbi:MAG: pseudouridine synthase [Minisyncoccota bacterium]
MEYPIRINKYLRDMGLASRRESDRLIENGYVLVNGIKATLGMVVNAGDAVVVNEGSKKKELVYLAYYKPWGIATQGLKNQPSVITTFQPKGIFPIGRLDKESEGLLLLTNDGRATTRVLSQDDKFEKEYIVEVREKLRGGIPAIFEKGMHTDIGDLLPAKARLMTDYRLNIVLREGKKHQIRVMLSELGYTVTLLKRIRIGHIKMGKLEPGKSRPLTQSEVDELFGIKK